MSNRLGDIDDLPIEVKNQLQIFNLKKIETQIIEIIKSYEKYANIDEVMVGLYRKYKIIIDRKDLMHRLYRLYKRGNLIRIEGKKGVYKIANN